jgi:hypothetical protein
MYVTKEKKMSGSNVRLKRDYASSCYVPTKFLPRYAQSIPTPKLDLKKSDVKKNHNTKPLGSDKNPV